MIPLVNNSNVDLSDLTNYPDGRIKDNDGTGNGTGVNRNVYGDIHSNLSKLMRLYAITPNVLPDNETNGYQLIEALIALSTKNTIVADISTSGGVLVAAMKLNMLVVGEKMYCKASCNFTTETTIKGTNAVTAFTLSTSGDFVIGDYVELVRTNSGVELRRIIDQGNIDSIVGTLNYLKAATNAEDLAGTITNKATTPASQLATFTDRVIGATSGNFLATIARNGLYPKEHWAIVNGLAANSVRNIGYFSNFDVDGGTIGSTFAVSGDLASATLTQKTTAGGSNGSVVRVVVNNTMTDANYFVRIHIRSNGASIFDDSTISHPTFRPINATTFDVCIRESPLSSETQNLQIHVEVVKI